MTTIVCKQELHSLTSIVHTQLNLSTRLKHFNVQLVSSEQTYVQVSALIFIILRTKEGF